MNLEENKKKKLVFLKIFLNKSLKHLHEAVSLNGNTGKKTLTVLFSGIKPEAA